MSRLIIAAGDITSSPVFFGRFRGKTAKEIYTCVKCVFMTGSVAKPLGFAAAQIPAELSKGVIYTAVGQLGDSAIGISPVLDSLDIYIELHIQVN